jgi:hypothetical protein
MGWAPSSWTAARYTVTLTSASLVGGVLGTVACGSSAHSDAPPTVATGGQGGSQFDGGVVDAGPAFTCAPELEADPQNCGFSGHDCLGASCANCTCEPTLLTDDFEWGVSSFAIDDSSLYLTTVGLGPDGGDDSRDGTTGAVLKCPLTGCAGSPTLLASQQWSTTPLR